MLKAVTSHHRHGGSPVGWLPGRRAPAKLCARHFRWKCLLRRHSLPVSSPPSVAHFPCSLEDTGVTRPRLRGSGFCVHSRAHVCMRASAHSVVTEHLPRTGHRPRAGAAQAGAGPSGETASNGGRVGSRERQGNTSAPRKAPAGGGKVPLVPFDFPPSVAKQSTAVCPVNTLKIQSRSPGVQQPGTEQSGGGGPLGKEGGSQRAGGPRGPPTGRDGSPACLRCPPASPADWTRPVTRQRRTDRNCICLLGLQDKAPRSGGPKQRTFTSSQSWRREAQDQGVSRGSFSLAW